MKKKTIFEFFMLIRTILSDAGWDVYITLNRIQISRKLLDEEETEAYEVTF